MSKKWIIVLVVAVGCALLLPFVVAALVVAVYLFMPAAPSKPPNQVPVAAPAVAPEAPAGEPGK